MHTSYHSLSGVPNNCNYQHRFQFHSFFLWKSNFSFLNIFQFDDNFRDIATYNFQTSSGRKIRTGVFLRSARLYEASDKDIAFLTQDDLDEGYKIKLVADMRSDHEIHGWKGFPDPVQGTSIHRQYNISDSSSSKLQSDMLAGRISRKSMINILETMNIGFATTHRLIFAQLLKDIVYNGGVPFLIHCTAGKDRTGWATSLILHILGVSEKDIMHDFLQSNCGWDKTSRLNTAALRLFSLFRTPVEAMEPLMRVRQSYLQAGIDAVMTEYGSWENYVEKGLNMNFKKLKKDLEEALLESFYRL